MGLMKLDLHPTDIALPSSLSINLNLHVITECPEFQKRLGDFAAHLVLLYYTFLLH